MFSSYFSKLNQFINLDKYFFASLIFLIILTILFFKNNDENKRKKYFLFCFFITIIIFTLWSSFLTIFQFIFWQNHPFSKYLLPPYQSINYFLSYSYFHFWRDFVFRLLGIIFVFLIMKGLNFTFKRDIFYDDEKILIPYLSLFFFFPYNIFFIFIGFFVLLLKLITLGILKNMRLGKRYTFRNYWLLLAWLIFLFQPLILTNYEILKYKP